MTASKLQSIWRAAAVMSLALTSCGADQPPAIDLAADHPLLSYSEFDRLDYLQDRAERVAERTQRCMASQGFEYAPGFDFSMRAPVIPGRIEQFGERGYGIASVATASVEAIRNLAADPPGVPASRSSAEQEAYAQALVGSADMTTSRPSGDSCVAQAQRDEGSIESLYDHLKELTNQVEVRAEADQRTVELHRKWADCMAASGYQYAHPIDPVVEFDHLVEELVDGAGVFSPTESATNRLIEQLDRISEQETNVAEADRKCQEPLREQKRSIWAEHFADAGGTLSDFELLNPATRID